MGMALRARTPEREIEDALTSLRAARIQHERTPHLVTEKTVEDYQQALDALLEQYPNRERKS